MRRGVAKLLITMLAVAGNLYFCERAQSQPFGPRIEWPFTGWFSKPQGPPSKPFVQSHAEERRIAGRLMQWEAAGRDTRNFSCHFTRWQYDRAFGPNNNGFLNSEGQGYLKYQAPAFAAYVETESKTYDAASSKYTQSSADLDHWLCDGSDVFWLHPRTQSIDVIPIPPSWQNRATVDGPLPFFFPIDAATLLKRFWFREVTPREQVGKYLWLEAWPTTSAEAASVRNFEIILDLPALTPIGLQIRLPNGGDRTAYLLEDYRRNEAATLGPDDFQPPASTTSWKRNVNPLPDSSANTETPAPAAAPQAAGLLAAPGKRTASTGCCRQNRSRANGGRLVHSRPGFSRFCRQGRVSCRIRCCGRFRRCCR